MDSSQQYIDMCQKAICLEQHHLWVRGDYYAEKILDRWYVDVFIGNEFYSVATDGTPMIHWVYLPKQDQLQAMMPDYQGNWLNYHGKIYDWVRRCRADRSYYLSDGKGKFTSMEQLWLSFVMKEKFNKHWNGTTWEVDNEND